MTIFECKRKALGTLKENSILISCAIEYILINIAVAFVSCCLSELDYFIVFKLGNGLHTLVKLGKSIIFSVITFQLMTAFVYMLIKRKTQFKRYFSFLDKRYWKYCLWISVTICLPCIICEKLSQEDSKGLVICVSILGYILTSFAWIMCFFKAAYPHENFQCIAKKVYCFIRKKIIKYILFEFSFLPYELIRMLVNGVLIFILKVEVEGFISSVLSASYSGVGIFFFPYYFLSFYYMINDPELMSCKQAMQAGEGVINEKT